MVYLTEQNSEQRTTFYINFCADIGISRRNECLHIHRKTMHISFNLEQNAVQSQNKMYVRISVIYVTSAIRRDNLKNKTEIS